MSEPKQASPYCRHDVRLWHGAWWVYMDGRPYRKATRHEILAAQVAAEPIADAVETAKRVAGL